MAMLAFTDCFVKPTELSIVKTLHNMAAVRLFLLKTLAQSGLQHLANVPHVFQSRFDVGQLTWVEIGAWRSFTQAYRWNPHLVTLLDFLVRFAATAVDPYLALANQAVNEASWRTLQLCQQQVIQALAGTIWPYFVHSYALIQNFRLGHL